MVAQASSPQAFRRECRKVFKGNRLTINALTLRRVLQRVLLGLGFGALLATVHLRWNLGILFLVGLCGAAAFFPTGLGLARFPVAVAIWAGQYLVFWLHVIAPTKVVDEMAGILYIINGIAIFMPAVAILTGTYIGIVLDRGRRPAPPQPNVSA